MPTRLILRRSGFTLVEILVVISIIALLITLALPVLQNAIDTSRSTACKSNLKQLGTNLRLWRTRNKDRWPKESGIRFLLVLARDSMIDEKDMKVFICPNQPEDDNTTETDNTPGSAYKDWDGIPSTSISYAGRDVKAFPIASTKEGSEIIASDDNEGRPNHKHATNYLYADASVDEFDMDTGARELGLDFKEQGFVPIGPDSPVEKFQKLRVD